MKRQKEIADSFLRNKDKIHAVEDPTFLDEMSDVLDIRNWNLKAFNPTATENEKDEMFESEMEKMMVKLEKSAKFYEDLDHRDLKIEFRMVLKMIYENEKQNGCLNQARNESHIIDQCTLLKNNVLSLHENDQKLWFRIVKRGESAPNAQTQCERANSDYNQFKRSLSNRMKLPMIKSRLRIKINGPPTSMFKPKAVRHLWLKEGHQYAETATQKKLVINRIRKKDKEKYTSKIFD